MATDLNTVALTGRLTKDPELRTIPSGMAVCNARLAFSTRRKDRDGDWTEKSNYITITVWGSRGEAFARYLSKGSRVGVTGRLEFREWETDSGGKRSTIEMTVDDFTFLDSKGDREDGGGGGGNPNGTQAVPQTDVPVESPSASGVAAPGSGGAAHGGDDIPF